MNETVFENMAEELKNNITRDIAYTYSVFAPAENEKVLFKMKSNIPLPDRKYIGTLLKDEEKKGLIFPCDVLEESIERHIDEFYNEFELSVKTRWQLSYYGDRADIFKRHFAENLEKIKSVTREAVFREIDSLVALERDAKTVIDRVDTILSGRIASLKRFLEDSAGQLEQYMLLWDYEDKGYTTYRNKSQGDTCKDCVELDNMLFQIKDAEFGVNLAPIHINCDCETEILDDAGNVVFKIERALNESKQENGLWDYLKTSVNQIIKGNYADDVNFVGTLGQIGLGFTGFDLLTDVRDISYDISNFKSTPGHIIQTVFDFASILPFIGVIKCADEAWEVLKAGIKKADEAIDAIKETVKHADEAADAAKAAWKSSDNLGKAEELIQLELKHIVNNFGKELDITPSRNHFILRKNPGYIGVPETSVDIIDETGEVVTRRWYDEYGKAVRDVDFTNHGNAGTHPEWPHEHIWKYSDDGKPTRK